MYLISHLIPPPSRPIYAVSLAPCSACPRSFMSYAFLLPSLAAGLRGRVMLTKTLEWNLYWCVLDCMFDEHFLVRRDFVRDARLLRQRLRFMAVCNVLVSPFLVLFLLTYFFLRNAETIYHHPSSVGARHWCASRRCLNPQPSNCRSPTRRRPSKNTSDECRN